MSVVGPTAAPPAPGLDTSSILVRSGLTELAASALSGWVYTLGRNQPELARKLGIKSVPRIRQWHLDMAMLGTASVACGLAAPDAPKVPTRALAVGAWTNAMLFLPMAFKPGIDEHPAFVGAATASFVATTTGFCGIAAHAWRAHRSR